MRKRHPLLRFFFFLGAFCAGAWLMGLVLFVMTASAFNKPSIDETLEPMQGIVVLTGGSERIEAGLELLKAQKGKKLLISGVYPGLSLSSLLAKHDVSDKLKTCCIAAGHEADNTVGNAEETKAWMKKEDFTSLRLVTSNYHMLRSLMLLRKEMPSYKIEPFAVEPDNVKLSEWWLWPGTAKLLVTEYNKYLLALSRIQVEPYL